MNPKPRILIAEDTPSDYDILSAVLRKHVGEYITTPTPVCTTSLCCAYLEARHWDLVIYDPHLLDQKNGKGLADVVRIAHAKGVPVVLLTGDMFFKAEEYPAAGLVDAFWEKEAAFKRGGDFCGLVSALIQGAA